MSGNRYLLFDSTAPFAAYSPACPPTGSPREGSGDDPAGLLPWEVGITPPDWLSGSRRLRVSGCSGGEECIDGERKGHGAGHVRPFTSTCVKHLENATSDSAEFGTSLNSVGRVLVTVGLACGRVDRSFVHGEGGGGECLPLDAERPRLLDGRNGKEEQGCSHQATDKNAPVHRDLLTWSRAEACGNRGSATPSPPSNGAG
jgi:hypothetical protein